MLDGHERTLSALLGVGLVAVSPGVLDEETGDAEVAAERREEQGRAAMLGVGLVAVRPSVLDEEADDGDVSSERRAGDVLGDARPGRLDKEADDAKVAGGGRGVQKGSAVCATGLFHVYHRLLDEETDDIEVTLLKMM